MPGETHWTAEDEWQLDRDGIEANYNPRPYKTADIDPPTFFNEDDTICSCGKRGEEAINSHIHLLSGLSRTETIITDPETGGQKGQKDVRIHATPWEAYQEVGRVYAFGEAKYDDYNFRKGYAWSLSFDALQRHLWSFWSREDRDSESGLHHLAHAVWHGFTLLFFSLTGRGKDDRPT